MNILILYDHLKLALKTNALLGIAARKAGAGLLNIKPWRLDLLITRPTAQTAMMDAVEAHLLILAIKTKEEVPGWFADWLEQWALQRQVQDATLAIFNGEDGEMLSATPTPVLSRFASRHGLSFIFGDLQPTQTRRPALMRTQEDLDEREAAQRILLRSVRLEPALRYCRRINE